MSELYKKTEDGVSIIIPAYNSEATIAECLGAATSLEWVGPLEVIVVNDGSSDRTAAIASSYPGVKVITTPNGGAARATNTGIHAAHYNTVVSLDADAVLEPDWLSKIMPAFNEPDVVAAAGYAITANKSVIGKIMGYDVEFRLGKIDSCSDHLYTMNTAYRREALLGVRLFNEDMKIGYDVDISRKLKAAGYRLILNKEAKCRHYWRDNIKGYLKQQYNYAYYRLELSQKYERPHDQVASPGMILQVPFTMFSFLTASLGSLVFPYALLVLFLPLLINLPEAVILFRKTRDKCVLALPIVFTLRNLTWCWAAVVWGLRRTVKFVAKAGRHEYGT